MFTIHANKSPKCGPHTLNCEDMDYAECTACGEGFDPMESVFYVDCSADCGESANVEPDADYPCYNGDCNGRLVSPLMSHGLV